MSADVVGNGTRFFTVHVILPSNASESTPQAHSLSRSLTIKYKPHDSINDIWKRSVRQFKRGYGIECPPGLYWSRLQTNDGGDLFMDDTAGDLYRSDAPQTELQLRFILAHIEDESPLPPGSALRPPDFRKREWSELSQEEQDGARKLQTWTAINDPTPTSAASTQDDQQHVASRVDADGFKIPGRPAKTPRKSRPEHVAAASQASATKSQSTVLVADSQPARAHPPTPTSGPGSSQMSSSQVSSNATPPSAQRPPDSQASQFGALVPSAHLDEDSTMMDYDPILDDELLGIESSQEQGPVAEASSSRTIAAGSSRAAQASSSRTATAGSSRNIKASTFRNVSGKAKSGIIESRKPRSYTGKGKQPVTSASSSHTPSGSSPITVNAFALMQQSQSSGGISVKSDKRVDQKWTDEQEQLVLHGVRRKWTYEQIRRALMPVVDRSASSIRGKMKAMREKIEAGTLSWDASSPLAPAAAPSSQATFSWTPGDIDKLRRGLRDGLSPRQIQTRLFPSRSEESIIKKSRKEILRAEYMSASQSRPLTFDPASSQLTSSAPSRSFQQSSPAEAASTRRGEEHMERDLDDEELSSEEEGEKKFKGELPEEDDEDEEMDEVLPLQREDQEAYGNIDEYELNNDLPDQAGPDRNTKARPASLGADEEDNEPVDSNLPTEPNAVGLVASEDSAARAVSQTRIETAYASPAESGEIAGAQKSKFTASRKRKAFVALGDRPDMSNVIDMRRTSEDRAVQHQVTSDAGQVRPKTEPVDSNGNAAVKAESAISEDESDVIDIKREDENRHHDSDKGSNSGSESFVPYRERRVFTRIEELETFCARPSRDFVGVAQIIPDYTARLRVPDIRHGTNPDGTEYTTVAPPYKKDEVLRPFRNVLSEMWKDALNKAKDDPVEALRRYKKDFTDNAMFKAIADQDNYRVAMIKELRQWRRRARAERKGQRVDDDEELSSSWSGDSSSDEEEMENSDSDENVASDMEQQEMQQSDGGGYAETVDSSDEDATGETDGATNMDGLRAADHDQTGSRLDQRIPDEGPRVPEACNGPAMSVLASQPKTAPLKRKASTLSSESEVSQHDTRRVLPSAQGVHISPVRNRAGEPVPRGAISKTQVRRKRARRRRKESLEGVGHAGSSEMNNDEEALACPDDIDVAAGAKSKSKMKKMKTTPATTKAEKLERRQKKREKRRKKEGKARSRNEDELAASSEATSRRASSDGVGQEDKSMLNIIREAKHVPMPKPRATQPSVPRLGHPSRIFGDSDEDEDSHGSSGSEEE